jgi:hypothetical protein
MKAAFAAGGGKKSRTSVLIPARGRKKNTPIL